MSVTENDAARQVNTANLRQWSAVLAADEWQRAWEAMAEPEDEKRVRCDTCGEECLLEEAIICPLSDCVTCPACLEAETMAGEEVLGGILR